MQLIVITAAHFIADEAAIINDMFAAGMPRLHIRKPDASAGQIQQLLQGIHSSYRPRLVLHHCHTLAAHYGITRLHFTEQARQQTDYHNWQQLQSDGYLLSTSLHQYASVATLPSCFEYAFLGPVFDSISKPGYYKTISDDFRLNKHTQPLPLIALGGITPDKLPQLQAMQFNGAAVMGFLWQQPAQAPQLMISLLNMPDFITT